MFHPPRQTGSPRPTAPRPFAGSGGFPRPAAPTSWGAGPEEEDLLRPGFLNNVRFKPGQGGAAAPWQLHVSPEERALFDKAHVVLDNPLPADTVKVDNSWDWNGGGASAYKGTRARTSQEATLAAARWLFVEAFITNASARGVSGVTAETQRAQAFARFEKERKQKELARKLLGIEAPTGFFGNRPPSTWRVLDAALGSDAFHRNIDEGKPSDYAAIRARFCDTRRRPAPPSGCASKFDTERWRLEFARAVVKAGPRTLLRQVSGGEGVLLGAPAPTPKQGQSIFIPGPQGTDLAEKPSTPAPPRFNPNLLRFNPSRRGPSAQLAPFEDAPPAEEGAPVASDPALLEELAALEVLATAPESIALANLPALTARAQELSAHPALLPDDQERAGLVADLLRAEQLHRIQEAAPSTETSMSEAPASSDPALSPPASDDKAPLTTDQQACADSMKALVEDAMKAGLTLDEARELLAGEVERHGPGLFRRLWNWVVQALHGLFDDDNDVPPSASAPSLPSEAAPQALPTAAADPLDDPTSDPPPGAETMGAGPEDGDPAPNFVERTQNRFLTLGKWIVGAAVILIGGWFIAATLIIPRVVASAAPVFGDVVRQGLQSGVQLQGAALSNADKVLPLLTGGAGGAASGAASLLTSGGAKALPLVLNA